MLALNRLLPQKKLLRGKNGLLSFSLFHTWLRLVTRGTPHTQKAKLVYLINEENKMGYVWMSEGMCVSVVKCVKPN